MKLKLYIMDGTDKCVYHHYHPHVVLNNLNSGISSHQTFAWPPGLYLTRGQLACYSVHLSSLLGFVDNSYGQLIVLTVYIDFSNGDALGKIPPHKGRRGLGQW